KPSDCDQEEPLNLIQLSLDEIIYVKMRNVQEIQDRLRAYDQHFNITKETVATIVTDEETYENIYKSTNRNIPILFFSGDGVVLIAPPLRFG
uniref:Sm domain-containing protein n=1 Tax=Salvator merianae TaxID=96440 RepID=A0A8D0C2Y1_SALMN